MRVSPFTIYNASAGSGKTFTLVKEYLKLVLQSPQQSIFGQILAVTFTNKAVNEMKERVLGNLARLSETAMEQPDGEMASILLEELELELPELQKRSRLVLQRILHNYAYFDISTIDKFTHRVIRTFARDLKLSHSFEVLLDTDILLEEAVDNLLDKSGENEALTQILVDFALQKTDEDKDWDIALDLKKVGKILFGENDLAHFEKLREKEMSDFHSLGQLLRKRIAENGSETIEKAETALALIAASGRQPEDFPYQTLPNHFKKLRDGIFDEKKLYDNKLEQQLLSGNILKAKVPPLPPDTAETLLKLYLDIKTLIYQSALYRNILQNLVPLTVVKSIFSEIKSIEKENDILPISSFNTLIAETIADQPVPFIYERLGEKYRHYFIDEFQDTSALQWHNLVPLVNNALDSSDGEVSSGSLMIVGDAKQAIYRWRGGKPEQFLGLISGSDNPFSFEPEVNVLDKNFRSARQIIEFNNDFFKKTSPKLGDPAYRKMFLDETEQKTNSQEGGIVQLEFIDTDKDKLDQSYLNSVLEIIAQARHQGYLYQDISILTRKNDQGVILSAGLIGLGIPVISSESLLLKSSPEVMFLMGLMKCALQPEDRESAYGVAHFLSEGKKDYHLHVLKAITELESWLMESWEFDLSVFRYQSLYDALETAIAKFGLGQKSDAFIAYFMDEVFAVGKRHGPGVDIFLDYWALKQDKLSITAPDSIDAVRVMTIHKAKGLEFPIVIYPYANTRIYGKNTSKLWYPVPPSDFSGFQEVRINKNKQMLNYGERANALYEEDNYKLELDAFNVLYVALTRAIDGLFILTEKGNGQSDYSGTFKDYLTTSGKWSETKNRYTFGTLHRKGREEKAVVPKSIPYLHSQLKSISAKLVIKPKDWDDSIADPRALGNFIHELMSLIKTEKDIEPALSRLHHLGRLRRENMGKYRDLLFKIVTHPELSYAFADDVTVMNERDIICENGLILRPDRLVIHKEKATIIDYKTGARDVAHKEQLLSYGRALKAMGYELKRSIIVYIDDTIETVFI